MKAKEKKVKFIENPNAPEIYATSASGFGYDAPGVVRVTFQSTRNEFSPNEMELAVMTNLRLVMPTANARQFVQELAAFLDKEQLNNTQKPPEQPMQ